MKKIDRLMLTGFVGPFIVTFFIAIFVLMMQRLWLYIDDIAGKGASIWMIMEFLVYLSVSLIPMALPIAVLISSVMVLGNMAEHYELSSFKSAGVPLWRVMLPLMFVAGGISVASFFINNNLIPVSNLKFKSRLYDMRKQKPTLSLEEGAFNDDFQGFAIRIGSKEADERTIHDILMYDHSESTKGRLTQVVAETGEMFPSPSEQYFVMRLENGHQYAEPKPNNNEPDKRSYPFVRTNFEEWEKVFDLSEFEIESTDEQLFKSHQSMLSVRQLDIAIDSIDEKLSERHRRMEEGTDNFFFFKQKELRERKKREEAQADSLRRTKQEEEIQQRYATQKEKLDSIDKKLTVPPKSPEKAIEELANRNRPKLQDAQRKARKYSGKAALKQDMTIALGQRNSILETFELTERNRLNEKAKSSVRSIKNQAESTVRTLMRIKESRVKHIHTLHNKFSMAVACFIFLFIGAPMGAIIRKGGFGYPILISIIFFMLFIMLTIASKKMAEEFVLHPVLAAWLPCLVLFPVGLILTYKAMNDSKLLNVDRYVAWVQNLFAAKDLTDKQVVEES
ncbi:MAG: LptF/LptG family permease [Saprospiraceae bacterium]